MSLVTVNFDVVTGTIKPMHAVNNGPIKSGYEQHRSNFETFQAAKIPFARNHDASFESAYGGEHTVDVHAIFPDFDADPYDPNSYDFFYTDEYTATILEAGTQVYYRLGTKIEHGGKKYGSLVPKDFDKWAVICEHIIRHYNEGWANGYHWNIRYWEIWNEPDGIAASGDQPNWSGTPEQFYEMYSIAARHLKGCFPDVMIGGPAMCDFHEKWLIDFLRYQKETNAPIDFIGWHWYGECPSWITTNALRFRDVLDREGYTHTESYLNEWNYLENWTDRFVASVEGIISMRGAALVAGVMCLGQKLPIDMLMYYDARPCAFCGMFDVYTYRPLKGYYPFRMFSALYELDREVENFSDDEEIYVTAAGNGQRHAAMIAYYSLDKNAGPRTVELKLSGLGNGKLRYYLLDEHNTMTEMALPENKKLILDPNSVVLVTDYCIND